MDYSLYHAINELARQHPWIGNASAALESWAIPVFALATAALWFLARPGRTRSWKLACGSAFASAALALLANQVIASVWARPRPYTSHPEAALFMGSSRDPSFPSDHASAAFAIATAVLLYHRRVGSVFLAAAGAVGVGRVLVGAHYPADVLVGAIVGAVAALLVVRFGTSAVDRIVRLVERLTDPVLAILWRHEPHFVGEDHDNALRPRRGPGP